MSRELRWAFTLTLAVTAAISTARAAAPAPTAVMQYAAESGSNTWKRAADPEKSNLSSRELFTYALTLCETRTYPERLEKLFALAAQMQDREPKSKSFGNFRWYWTHPKVDDANAVDFCMQSGAIIWTRHRDWLPATARTTLSELLEFACEGSRRHKVRSDYTNIALMNATNLILLGEQLKKPDIAAEGYKRLDAAVLYTFRNGTHEYCSPTYYGVDVAVLAGLERFCARDRERQMARAMLQLFWTDIAANWFPAAQRLGGTCSRTYDYLRGLGELDVALSVAGWIPGPTGGPATVYSALASSQPPLPQMQAPRLVEQNWGESNAHFRTHYVLPDVTLGCSAGYYGGWMDMPLTADFAGPRDAVRCYYIPDGRQDPYGKIKIAAGAHQKAFHLGPFFTAAQRTVDAASLVVYRETDIPTNATTLQTHFVLPKNVDGLWIGERRIELPAKKPATFAVGVGEPVVVHKGTATVGIRVPWARAANGQPAPAALVWDGNKFGAIRLTIDHGVTPRAGLPAAALWVRVGSGLDTAAKVENWRKDFAAAIAQTKIQTDTVELRVTGVDGPVAVAAAAPFKTFSQLEPAPRRVVLAIDGKDVGHALLEKLDCVK